MNPQIAELLAQDHKFQSMFSSCIGTLIQLMAQVGDQTDGLNSADLREQVSGIVANIIGSVKPDRTCWAHCKGQMHYDVYLKMRREAGTITDYDLIRPTLFEKDFSELMEYFEHYQRVVIARKALESRGGTAGKTCAKCGCTKPKESFKRGSVCNSCRSRMYRERKKSGVVEAVNDEGDGRE